MSIPADCPLTPGQFRVLSLLCEGRTYKQAARDLGLSAHTIRTQASYAYGRLGVPNAAQAAVLFMRRGWTVHPPEPDRDQSVTPAQRAYLAAFDEHLTARSTQVARKARAQMRLALYGVRHEADLPVKSVAPPSRDPLDRVVAALGAATIRGMKAA